jgi:hypothetical protein
MKRKLYIHVGPHKTATSAIQGYFVAQGTSSLLYPKTGRWTDGAHHKLSFAARGINDYGTIAVPPWGELLEALDKEIAASTKGILLSSEEATPALINALAPIIAKHDLMLIFILVLRNPIERAASLYNQWVKDPATGVDEDPDVYLKNHFQEFEFKRVYEKWKSLNRPMIVVPFKSKLPLVQRFCAAINESYNKPVMEDFLNPSMGGAALLAMLLANKLSKDENQRRSFFNQLVDDPQFHIWRGASFPFSHKACEEFFTAIQPDIEWVVKTFSFERTPLKNPRKQRFSLTIEEQQSIYQHLENANLIPRDKRVITQTIRPFALTSQTIEC